MSEQIPMQTKNEIINNPMETIKKFFARVANETTPEQARECANNDCEECDK